MIHQRSRKKRRSAVGYLHGHSVLAACCVCSISNVFSFLIPHQTHRKSLPSLLSLPPYSDNSIESSQPPAAPLLQVNSKAGASMREGAYSWISSFPGGTRFHPTNRNSPHSAVCLLPHYLGITNYSGAASACLTHSQSRV